MIDTLLKHKKMASNLELKESLGLESGKYATLTMHRPSNVDDKQTLKSILEALREISSELPIIFPIHPRTRKMVDQFNFGHYFNNSS